MPPGADVFQIALAPGGSLYATDYNSGVYRSTDSGAHWTAVNAGLGGTSGYWAIAADPADPAKLYLATDFHAAGLFKTTDSGAHWSRSEKGISAHWVNAVALDPERDATLYAGTLFSGVFRTSDGGISWFTSDRIDLPITALLVDRGDPSVVFAAVQREGGIFRSDDGGATWKQTSQGATGSFYALAQAGTAVYMGGSGGVFVSADRGAHWSPSSTGLTGDNVKTIAVDSANAALVYAGNSSGVFKSVNGGHSWSPSSVGLPADEEVEVVAIDPAVPSHLLAGLAGGQVFASLDGGAHWSPRDTGLSSTGAAKGMAFDSTAPGRVWVATFGAGVFQSDDGGAHWAAVNSGLTTSEVNAVITDVRRHAVYAGVAGGGVEALVPPRGVLPVVPAAPSRVEPRR